MLARARGMVGGTLAITKTWAAAAKAKTPGEAQRKLLQVAPLYLKRRVEVGNALPEVEVSGGKARKRARSSEGEGEDEGGGADEEAFKKEELRAVVGHVLTGLKGELVVELLQALRPKWSEGKATWEGIELWVVEEED